MGRADECIGHALCANWLEAREEGAIGVERCFNDVGANRLNADTAGDVDATTDFSTGCWVKMPVMSVKEPPSARWSSLCITRLICPCGLLLNPAWKYSVSASLRYTNGAEPKTATIASNEPAWLKNSLTEATSVMSMPGEELREAAKTSSP